MKYGDALAQRSVAEWLPYNLDYNDLKEFIKANTLDRPGRNDPEASSHFEQELFQQLSDQYDRINMFVKSKSGEIDSRLAHCNRQVQSLRRRADSPISRRRFDRIERAEEDIQKVSYDIQALSRFVGVQRTGFRKILKKYKKWTNSRTLSAQFLPILDAPGAFTQRDFNPLLLQVGIMSNTIREPLAESSRTPNLTPTSLERTLGNISSMNAQNMFNLASTTATDAEIDIALAANHLSYGGKAVYWVHNDHVVEVQLIILKYLSLKTWENGSNSPIVSSPAISRRGSYVDPVIGMGKDDDVGTIIFDNLDRFANAQSSATIAESSLQETCPQAQIYWCRTEKDTDAAMVLQNDAALSTQSPIKFKKKYIQDIVRSSASKEISQMKTAAKVGESKESLSKICDWITTHQTVQPLVQILSRRSRFMDGSANAHTWAVLDREIKYSIPDVSGGLTGEPIVSTASFPHAVLEIRWNDGLPELVAELDKTHVVERVRGFSLDVHAVAVLYQPLSLRAPFWFAALERDIRKTPDTDAKSASRNTRRQNANGPTTSHQSLSNTSATLAGNSDALESSTTLMSEESIAAIASRKKPRISNAKLVKKKQQAATGRYWNEFDDETEDEPYTVLVQPDDRNNFTYLTDKLHSSLLMLHRWMRSEPDAQEAQPFFISYAEPDLESESHRTLAGRMQYDTITVTKGNHDIYRSRRIMQAYMICLALAVIIMTIVGLVCYTTSNLALGGDIGSFVFIIIALILAVIAISLFLVQADGIGWVHKATVLTIFALVCIAAGIVLAVIGAGLGVDGG